MKVIPNIVQELRKCDPETRPTNMLQFLRTLADMQDLTLKRLTTTVEEERSRQELLEHYISREQEKAQSSRTEVLTKLKADLLDVKDSTELRMRQLREKYEGRMAEHLDRFNQQEALYKKRIE